MPPFYETVGSLREVLARCRGAPRPDIPTVALEYGHRRQVRRALSYCYLRLPAVLQVAKDALGPADQTQSVGRVRASLL